MADALYKAPAFAILMYCLAIVTFILYIYFKWRQRRLITICNLTIFRLFVTYVILTPFQFQDAAWKALGRSDAAPFYPYLFKSISINFMGFIVFVLAEILFENRKRKNNKLSIGERLSTYADNVGSYPVNLLIFYFAAIAWLYVVYRYNNGIPLFNGGRGFYYNQGIISYIYQGINGVVAIYGFYFGIDLVSRRRSLIPFLLACFLSFGTASRGSLIQGILFPTIICLLYKRYRKINIMKLFKVIPIIVILIVFGLLLGILRGSSRSASGAQVISSAIYGNTFSDLRDGAFIFYGYERKFGDQFLWGKTYLAGLLSFIPSSMSPFRIDWSWGRVTSLRLFGLQEHFGLRGGDVAEAYLNFGLLGVIVLSIFRGFVFAGMERLCNSRIYSRLKNHENIDIGFVFPYKLMEALSSFLVASSGIRELYVLTVLMLTIVIVNRFMPRKLREPKGK